MIIIFLIILILFVRFVVILIKPNMNKNLLFISLVGLLFFSCKKDAVTIVGELEGTVQNEFGQPIEGVLIKVETYSAKSDVMGKYSINKIPVQEYSVSASKEFFLTKVQRINISQNKTARLDFSLIAGVVYLNLSDSILDFDEKGGVFDIKVTSNAGWMIMGNSSTWLTTDVSSGEGNGHVGIRVAMSQEDSVRNVTVQFVSGSAKKTLSISQLAPVKILKCKGIIGNGANNTKDSAYILFNKAVTVTNFANIPTDKGYGIKFSMSGIKLGNEYPCGIAGTDNEGRNFNISAKVPFYRSKLKLDGIITDYLLINNDKEILISAYLPCRVIRYSIESNSIIQTYDFSQSLTPFKMAYNPYNSKVYIIGCPPNAIFGHAGVNLPDIYTLDLQTGEIIKAITFHPDAEDHPQAPAIIPFNLGFTKNGTGIVLLKAMESSSLRWKFVNTANKDSIYTYPYYDASLDKYTIFFDQIYPNFDGSKLFLGQPWGYGDYGLFDQTTGRISFVSADPGTGTRNVYITPYRKSDKFFAGQLYLQFISDLAGNKSMLSYIEHPGSADFSYRENEEDVVYVMDSYYFYYMDYKNGTTPMWCEFADGMALNKFISTTDGKYAIGLTYNPEFSSNLLIFDTQSFSRYIK